MDCPSPSAISTADTIFAVSSGSLPSAIAILRVSGPLAGAVAFGIAGSRPEPRVATLRTLRNADGEILDRAMVLWFPGPRTVTGEDLCEFQVHGGRAVIEAVSKALLDFGCRLAVPGEFTRRALSNGKMSLDAVEGLADLLAAETESQRKDSIARAEGAVSRKLAAWRAALIDIAAQVEAAIDYDGDGDVTGAADAMVEQLRVLAYEIDLALQIAPAERLRNGVCVVIAGPVNAGKSTLFNALVGCDAAIVSDIPGTTRDLIERTVAIDGVPFVLVDTAGVRNASDPIESMGIERAERARARADIVIDLGSGATSPNALHVSAMADIKLPKGEALPVSAVTGEGIAALQKRLCEVARLLLPDAGEVAFDRRHREALGKVREELVCSQRAIEQVLIAHHLRQAIVHMDRVLDGEGLEDMLDALFARFCLGK